MAGSIMVPASSTQKTVAAGQGLNSTSQTIPTDQPFVESWALYSVAVPWVVQTSCAAGGSLATTQTFNWRLFIDGSPIFVTSEQADMVSELVSPPVSIAAGVIATSFATPIPFNAGSTVAYSYDAIAGGAPQAFSLTVYIGYSVVGSANITPDQGVILYEASRRMRPITGALED